jgi:hypothetical protein
MAGWLKLYRKFTEWEWYNNSEMVHLFIHLLINANFSDKKVNGEVVKRGELLTGRKELSKTLNISERSIRTCLSRLLATNEITIKTTNRFSVITIYNYDYYQVQENVNDQQNDQQNDHQPTSRILKIDQQNDQRNGNDDKDSMILTPTKRPTEIEKSTTINKNIKNNNNRDVKKLENIIPPPKEELKKYCLLKGINSSKFYNHYESKGWYVGKNKMKDWMAAVRGWTPDEKWKTDFNDYKKNCEFALNFYLNDDTFLNKVKTKFPGIDIEIVKRLIEHNRNIKCKKENYWKEVINITKDNSVIDWEYIIIKDILDEGIYKPKQQQLQFGQ